MSDLTLLIKALKAEIQERSITPERLGTILERLRADNLEKILQTAVQAEPAAEGKAWLFTGTDSTKTYLTPLTSSKAVISTDGKSIHDQRLQDLKDIDALIRGTGASADADNYPVKFLGRFASIEQVNAAADLAFASIGNMRFQGHLRCTRSGQAIFIDQFAIDYSTGKWAQMAYGMIAPSANGNALIRSSERPSIVFRVKDVNDSKWQFLMQEQSLKTINGQSIVGNGNIEIGQQLSINVDADLDASSSNPVRNSTVTAALQTLENSVDMKLEQLEENTGAIEVMRSDMVDIQEDIIGLDQTQNAQTQRINDIKTDIQNQQEIFNRLCKTVLVWSEDYRDGEREWEKGMLWYNPQTDVLSVCVRADSVLSFDETEFTEGLYYDKQHDQFYVFGQGHLKRIGSSDNGQQISIDSTLSTSSDNPLQNKVITEEFQKIRRLIADMDSSQEAAPVVVSDIKDYTKDSQYPEYSEYGAKGDGINYYDWPLACYEGEVNGVSVEEGAVEVEVSAPAERIFDNFGLDMPYTAHDVRFDSSRCAFLLRVGVKYYSQWLNSYYYNDPATGKARTDTVFSDITLISGSNRSSVRTSKIYQGGTDLVSILDTMTDDTSAIQAWFAANNGSGKTARLRPGAIYFLGSLQIGNFLALANGATIEGNGATLFVRTLSTGASASPDLSNGGDFGTTILRADGKNGITINNLKIKALKDRDGTPPTNNKNLSSSSSNITGITIYGNTNNVHVNNIEFRNMGNDFDLRAGYKIFIDGWKSVGVKNNALGTTETYITNADLTSAEYMGCGPHLFYAGAKCDKVFFKNCRFRAGDGYQEVLISFHASENCPPEGTTRHVYFDDCVIEAGAMLKGNGYGVMGRQWIHFRRCTLRKTFESVASSGEQKIGSREMLAWMDTNSWEFSDCIIDIGYGYLFTQCGGGYQNLVIRNTAIYSKLATADSPLVKGFSGPCDTHNIWTNYPGAIGFNTENDKNTKAIEDLGALINNLYEQLTGSSEVVPAYSSAPTMPAVGDKYRNTTDGKTYVCTALGKATRLGINLNAAMTGAPYTTEQTVTFNELESVTFSFDNISSLDDLKDTITAQCEAAGYINGSGKIKSSTWGIGLYYIYTSGSSVYLILTSKQQGNFTGASISGKASDMPLKGFTASGTSQVYQCGPGSDPTWEETTNGGILASLAALNDRVTALENTGGNTADNGGGSGAGTEQMN